MNKKLKLAIGGAVVAALVSLFMCCSGVEINIGEADQEKICYAGGKAVAAIVLKDHKDYIPGVKDSINSALETANSETVDVAVLIEDIMDFADEFIDSPEFETYEIEVKTALEVFKGVVVLNFDIPDNVEKTLPLIEAFLNGALDGIAIIE